MTKRNNTQSANLTLGGITLGFLVSYPFYLQGSFIGGLISSGCSAGMIGGLADWFAVTALFRRPLGIRPGKVVRTEIIPQNRERIFAALADMVQNELLSQDLLRRKLSAWDFSKVLIRVFQEKEVQETVNLMLTNLAADIWNQREPQEFRRQIKGLLRENIGDLKLSQTLAEVIEFSIEHGDIDQVLKVVCRAISEYVDQTVVQDNLKDMMAAALTRYAENNPTRKMIGMFLPSPAELAQGLQGKVKTVLEDGTAGKWLKEGLPQFVLELNTNTSLQERVDFLVLEALDRGLDTLNANLSPLTKRLLVSLRNNWQLYLERIEQNQSFRTKINEEVKGFLEKQILYHHNAIGRIVREGLDPWTDDKLVELIEDKAGNDLQMIRINGSVVGGLAGMLIYLLGMVLQS